MTVSELYALPGLTLLNDGGNGEDELTDVYCCDLLSCVMGNAPAGCAWVTVMNNINTLAVASLTECAAVILAEDVQADAALIAKAAAQDITLLRAEKPVFPTALAIHQAMQG